MKRLLIWFLLLPLQTCLILLFLISDLIHQLKALFYRWRADVTPVDREQCSIVVLNWNGRHLLEESLPALIRAVRNSGDHQIVVVDNGSEDDSVAWLRQQYPEVDILQLHENLGFVEGNNRGVQFACHPIVILLNNDMIVSPDFLDPLLEAFEDPLVFAVSSQIEFPRERRREETGRTQGAFRLGFLHLSHEPIESFCRSGQPVPALWAGGGSSAFRRDRFLRLGGFSTLFSPCYFEDTDLSYRAWRRGWKVLLAARSRVLHKHRSSTSVRFSPRQLGQLVEERRLWYLWSNYQWRTLLPHFLLFPLNLTKWTSPRVYLAALRRLPQALLKRLREPRRSCSDREILSWSSRPFLYFKRWGKRRRLTVSSPGDRLRILVLSAYLPHLGTHGGAGRVFQFLSRIARQHRVTLLTFIEDDKDLAFLNQVNECCARVETVSRRGYRPLSPFAYEPFEEFNVPEFRERLEHLLCEESYDLVHFEWTQMALYAGLFDGVPKLLTEVEVNYAAHQTLVDVEENPLRKARLHYNTLQTLYREVEMCRRVDHVICVTEEDRDYLEGHIPSQKLEVVNTGVDTDYFAYQPQGSQPDTLVFVGAFRHSPNIDAMNYFCSRIFPLILLERPQTQLYIVGSSPPYEIKRLAEHPNICVTGFVEDIREYYRLAQVIIVPLRTGVGIRGKILEGWSVGRATVATPLACQGLRSVHGENIMVAENPQDFAQWTLALLRSPDFCRRLGAMGRKTVEAKYDWRLLAEKMLRVYEKAATGVREEA